MGPRSWPSDQRGCLQFPLVIRPRENEGRLCCSVLVSVGCVAVHFTCLFMFFSSLQTYLPATFLSRLSRPPSPGRVVGTGLGHPRGDVGFVLVVEIGKCHFYTGPENMC